MSGIKTFNILIKIILQISIISVFSFAHAIEIIDDKSFTNGFRKAPSRGPECSFPVANRPAGSWHFVEVAENTFFCANPANKPNTAISARTSLISSNGAKSFSFGNGAARMKYNSKQEWINGCNMQNAPNYGDPVTHWPHLLFANTLPNTDSSGFISQTERNSFGLNYSFTFSAEFKLNKLTKNGSECDLESDPSLHYGAQNRALFYIGLVLVKKQYDRLIAPGRNKIYLVINAARLGNNFSTPWLGNDQLSDSNPVYITADNEYGIGSPNGQWKSVTFNVNKVAQQALDKIYKQHGEYHKLEDYYVGELYLGWEIWGGFDTDIEFKNISLQKSTSNAYASLHRYWNHPAGDHYYTTDYIPGGFLGYVYEGNIGRLSINQPSGTKPFVQFYNAANADHAYSTSPTQSPGNGYEFEKTLGYLSPLNTGTKLYEYWEPNIRDHYYTQDYIPGGFSGYQYQGRFPGDLK
ncbi:MAG: hypothetical protein IT525_09110 [Nitrosomonas sp.]|nr:hypothetical protein [Nitrosomonas sp.]